MKLKFASVLTQLVFSLAILSLSRQAYSTTFSYRDFEDLAFPDPIHFSNTLVPIENTFSNADEQNFNSLLNLPEGKLPKLNRTNVQLAVNNALQTRKHRFSGSVLVMQNSEVLYHGNFGNLSQTSKATYQDHTHFLLASVTKQFTAALVLKQVQSGKINLDDSVTRYLPSAPATWKNITIRQLLSHTAGLSDYLKTYMHVKMRGPVTIDGILSTIYRLDSHPKSGTEYSYSNSGYFVLGKVLEGVTHLTYPQLIENEIFIPLGMSHSGVLKTGMSFPHEDLKADQVADANLLSESPQLLFAVGDVYSNIADLSRWMRALFVDHSFLRSDLISEMMTAQPQTGLIIPNSFYGTGSVGYEIGYGLGLHLTKIKDKTIVWHTGHLNGHTTLVEHIVEDGISIVVLTNSTEAPVREVANKVTESVFSSPSLPPPLIPTKTLKKTIDKKLTQRNGLSEN